MTDEEKEAQRQRVEDVLDSVAVIFAFGFSDGMAQTSEGFGLESLIPKASEKLDAALRVRMTQVKESLTLYREKIVAKTREYVEMGLSGPVLEGHVSEYAHDLANEKSDLIAQTEATSGRYAGGKALIEESDDDFQWRFPHFDIQGDVECEVCEEIRLGSPYSTEEAEEAGYPMMPHPNCDHGWLVVQVGEKSLTETFNQ